MSKRIGPQPGLLLFDNVRLMQTHEAMIDLIGGRTPPYGSLFNTLCCDIDLGYSDRVYYDDLSDDDDDDDNKYVGPNNGYCGFVQSFLDKGVSKQLPAKTHYKTVRGITSEEAAKNAKELLVEEEKLKKKAEKKKLKKTRQRERRRLEKLEKESGNEADSKQTAAAQIKSNPALKEQERKKKTNNCVASDPDPQKNSVATESSDSVGDDDDDDDSYDNEDDDDDDDDGGDSIVDELELDMSSCFVTNAAAIARRKLEQKPKTDRKDKKAENATKLGKPPQNTSKPLIKNVGEASEEPVKDNVTRSMELAVIGNKCAQTGNLDMAIKYFTNAIKHNPQEFKLFGNRSFCYEKMQQYEKALIDADIALSLNPTWIKGLYRKGKALVGLERYYDACLTYKDVLKLDSTCTDAAQELMRVQILQLVDIGYSREQSSNALIIHGTVEKALEALSGLHGNAGAANRPFDKVVYPERSPQPTKVPLRPVSQDPPKVSTAAPPTPRELFPVWVGDLVPVISELELRELFGKFGPVHSVRLLSIKRCAFINYTNKEHCERAIKEMHGFRIAGTCLAVRYPDRIHTHLGVSKVAETDAVKVYKFPDECFFWRTTGCIKINRCPYRHVPEHRGIDRPQLKR